MASIWTLFQMLNLNGLGLKYGRVHHLISIALAASLGEDLQIWNTELFYSTWGKFRGQPLYATMWLQMLGLLLGLIVSLLHVRTLQHVLLIFSYIVSYKKI